MSSGGLSLWSLSTFSVCFACAPLVVDAFEPDREPPAAATCPHNPGRAAPQGPCGCSSFTDTARCDELRAAVRNLYTFDGTGTAIVDLRSDMDGTLLHTVPDTPPAELSQLQQGGRLTLDGGGSYVELPAGMISRLGSATFEVWISWRGNEFWTRVFDFGDNGGDPVDGVTYLFLTPANASTGTPRVAYSLAGPLQEVIAEAASPLPARDDAGAGPDHLAVVIDRNDASMRLYSGGVEVSSVTLPGDLAAINDANNWLGRSNYLVDPALSATFIELRIYDQALSAAQISASFQAGPGALD